MNSDTLVCVAEGGLIQDQGKLRLEMGPEHPAETQALFASPVDEIMDEKSILNKMYKLAELLQERNFEILNVEKKMDQEDVYVLKVSGGNAGVNWIKYSPHQTEIFTDQDDSYFTILGCIKDVLGITAV